MITAKEFRNQYIGKAIDVDGAAGVQCVDLFKQCCYLAGKKPFSLGGSGYACEIWKRFSALKLGEYFTKISDISKLQYGDWVVWDMKSVEAPNSHVAMFEDWNGKNHAVFFGQNQGAKGGAANEITISMHGVLGALRLKNWVFTCPFKKSGTVKALYNRITVRDTPNTSVGDTGARYDAGMTLNYSSIVKADGWYWAKYKSWDGPTHYCALCSVDGKKIYWEQV